MTDREPTQSELLDMLMPDDLPDYATLNEDYWSRVRFLPKEAQIAWHEKNK